MDTKTHIKFTTARKTAVKTKQTIVITKMSASHHRFKEGLGPHFTADTLERCY
jgi:hypothetical protein